MKKEKTTIKDLKNNYAKVIKLGYCQAQRLFPEYEAVYYNAGVYGWNFDCFVVDDVLITTGYSRTFGIVPSRELVTEYDKKAQDLDHTNYEEFLNNLHELQKEFINAVLG